jgi:hypothetical protein
LFLKFHKIENNVYNLETTGLLSGTKGQAIKAPSPVTWKEGMSSQLGAKLIDRFSERGTMAGARVRWFLSRDELCGVRMYSEAAERCLLSESKWTKI